MDDENRYKQLAKRLAKSKTELKNKIRSISSDKEIEINRLSNFYEKEKEKLESKVKEYEHKFKTQPKIEEISAQYETRIEHLENTISDLESRITYDKEVEKEKDRIILEKENVINDKVNIIISLQTVKEQLERQIRNVQKLKDEHIVKANYELEKQRNDYEQKLKDIPNNYKNKIQELIFESETKILEQERSYKEKLSMIEKENTNKINELQYNFERKIEGIVDEYENTLTINKKRISNLEKENDNIKNTYNKEIEKIKSEIDKKDKEIILLNNDFNSKLMIKNKEINNILLSKEKIQGELTDENNTLKEKNEVLRNNLAKIHEQSQTTVDQTALILKKQRQDIETELSNKNNIIVNLKSEISNITQTNNKIINNLELNIQNQEVKLEQERDKNKKYELELQRREKIYNDIINLENNIAILQKEKIDFVNHIHTLQNDNIKLKSEIDTILTENKMYIDELNKIGNYNPDKEYEQKIEQIRAQNKESNRQFLETLNSLQNKIKELEIQIMNNETVFNKEKEKLKCEYDNTVSTLHKKIQESEQSYENKLQNIEIQYKKEIESVILDTKIERENNHKKEQQLRNEIMYITDKNMNFQKIIEQLENTQNQYKKDKEQISYNNILNEQKVEKVISEYKNLEKILQDEKEQKKNVENQLRNIESRYEDKIKKLKKEYEVELNNNVLNYKNNIRGINQEKNGLDKKINNLENHILNLQQENIKIKQDYSSNSILYENKYKQECEKLKESYEGQLKLLITNNQNLTFKLSKLSEECIMYNELNLKYKEVSAMFSKLERENKILLSNLEHDKEVYNNLFEKTNKYYADKERLERENISLTNELENLQSELTKSKSDLANKCVILETKYNKELEYHKNEIDLSKKENNRILNLLNEKEYLYEQNKLEYNEILKKLENTQQNLKNIEKQYSELQNNFNRIQDDNMFLQNRLANINNETKYKILETEEMFNKKINNIENDKNSEILLLKQENFNSDKNNIEMKNNFTTIINKLSYTLNEKEINIQKLRQENEKLVLKQEETIKILDSLHSSEEKYRILLINYNKLTHDYESIKHLPNVLNEKNQNIIELNNTISTIQRKFNNDIYEKEQKAIEEIKNLEKTIQFGNAQIQNYKDTIEKLRDDFKKQLEETKRVYPHDKDVINRLEQEKEILVSQVEQQNRKIENLQNEIVSNNAIVSYKSKLLEEKEIELKKQEEIIKNTPPKILDPTLKKGRDEAINIMRVAQQQLNELTKEYKILQEKYNIIEEALKVAIREKEMVIESHNKNVEILNLYKRKEIEN